MNELIDRSLLVTVLITSFLGSWHCAGMCGPLAYIASQKNKWSYHLGRGLVYIFLGYIVGALGESLLKMDLSWIRWAGTALMLAFLSYVFFGYLGIIQKNYSALNSRIFRKINLKNRSGFAIGTLTGLLPCGWLWINLSTAASSLQGPLGAMIMLLFWVGTLPALIGATQVIQKQLPNPLLKNKKPLLWGLYIISCASVIIQLWLVENGLHCRINP